MGLKPFSAEEDSLFEFAPAKNPGYHTTIEADRRVRPTRENAYKALELLREGNPKARRRAEGILKALVGLQDRKRGSPTYGLWPWYFEEPLTTMTSPDFNWAGFIGGTLAVIVRHHHDSMDRHLLVGVKAALLAAAECIRKRTVGPEYTNVAVMTATLTVVSGELLDRPDLLEFGIQRIRAFEAHTLRQGSFNEYNSPVYMLITLQEFERAIFLSTNDEMIRITERLRRMTWKWIADYFHPPTGQWSGPFSRAYSDYLAEDSAEAIERRIGLRLPGRGALGLAPPPSEGELPCPEKLRKRFLALPEKNLTFTQQYLSSDSNGESIRGTVWMDDHACLGTVNMDTLWTQRRPVIGYLREESGTPAVLRFQVLRDGRDWASSCLYTHQKGPSTLVAVGGVRDGGDFHLFLDRPENGRFKTNTLSACWSLRADHIETERFDHDLFRLAAGGHRVWLRLPEPQINGVEATWKIESGPGIVRLVALWDFGGTEIDPKCLDIRITGAVCLVSNGKEEPPPPTILSEAGNGNGASRSFSSGDLEVQLPKRVPGFRLIE